MEGVPTKILGRATLNELSSMTWGVVTQSPEPGAHV